MKDNLLGPELSVYSFKFLVDSLVCTEISLVNFTRQLFEKPLSLTLQFFEVALNLINFFFSYSLLFLLSLNELQSS
jgi:hypothetical protein